MSIVMRCNYLGKFFYSMLMVVVIFNISNVNASPQNDEEVFVINKSSLDTREYLYFELDNGLKVVVVSDFESDISAVALDVEVGSSQDPDSRLGLAHLLERMIYMSSAKYPEIGGFERFLESAGGGRSADTKSCNTIHSFYINSEFLESALDQFLQLFISPSFNPKCLDKALDELQAKFLLDLDDDQKRKNRIVSLSGNPDNLGTRFTGNKDTLLKDDNKSLEADLKDFFSKYYHALNMTLVVLGNESVQILQNKVRDLFTEVADVKLSKIKKTTAKYTHEELGKRIDIESKENIIGLQLTFPFYEVWSCYKTKPLEYITYLLKNEEKGSFFRLLCDNKWAKKMIVKLDHSPSENISNIHVCFDLTNIGFANIDELVAQFLDYVHLIREQGVQKRIFDELAQMNSLGFKYYDRNLPLDWVCQLASNLHYYPVADLLGVPNIEYDSELIIQCLDKIKPENMLQIVLKKNGLNTDKVEPYYQAKYGNSSVSTLIVDRITKTSEHIQFCIPAPNPFIPNDISLQSEEVETEYVPELIEQQPGFELWGLISCRDKIPKGSVYINICEAIDFHVPENYICRMIYGYLLEINRNIQRNTTMAKKAGLELSITSDETGVQCIVNGYIDKQHAFLAEILSNFKNLIFDDDDLKFAKGKVWSEITNKTEKQSIENLKTHVKKLVMGNIRDKNIQGKILCKQTKKSLQNYITEFYKYLHIKMMVHGNYTKKTANDLGNIVSKHLQGEKPSHDFFYKSQNNFYGYIDKTAFSLDLNYHNSVVIVHYLAPKNDPGIFARYILLGSMLHSYYNQGKKNKGQSPFYINITNELFMGCPSIVLMIESSETNLELLKSEINNLFSDYSHELTSFNNVKLQNYKDGLINMITKQHKDKFETSEDIWETIVSDDTSYDSEVITDNVKQVTLEEIKELIIEFKQNKHRIVFCGRGHSFYNKGVFLLNSLKNYFKI